MKRSAGIGLALLAGCSSVGAAEFIYHSQARLIDMAARATNPSGQVNSPLVDSATNFGLYDVDFSRSATNGGAFATLTCQQRSNLMNQEIVAKLVALGFASRMDPTTESAMVFNHNIVDVVFRVDSPTQLLVEGQTEFSSSSGNTIAELVVREGPINPIYSAGDLPGSFGTVFSLAPGTHYRLSAGADIAAFASQTTALAQASAKIEFSVELGAELADQFEVIQGTPFGGGLSSLSYKDGDALMVLNDEFDPNAEVIVRSTLHLSQPGTLSMHWRSRSARQGMSELVFARNTNTGSWDLASSAPLSPNWEDHTVQLQPSTNYVNVAGQTQGRVLAVPMEDLETVDGWSFELDAFRWNAH